MSSQFTDEEFAEKTNLMLQWASHFRVPREWWQGSPVRQAVARRVRERIAEDMPVIVRKIRALRANDQVEESDVLLRRTIDYVGNTQRLFPRLLDAAENASLLESFSDGVAALARAAASVAIVVAEGATNVANNIVGGVSNLLPILVLGFGAMFLFSQRKGAR